MKLPKRWSIVLGGICLITGMLLIQGVFASDSVEELQKQIDDLQRMKEMSEAATKPLEKELVNIQARVANIKRDLAAADAETKHLEGDIESRELQLDAQIKYLAARVRSYYKLSRQYSPLTTFLAAHSAAGLTKQIAYRTTAVDQDKQIISRTTQTLMKLEEDKKALEQRKARMQTLRNQFETNAAFFDGEIKNAKAYQQQLEGKIAELSARQQEIIAAKSGGFNANIGDSELADDYKASLKGFNESAPNGYFAVFSFGGYSHRKGMSQYGARGRAEKGQDYDEILEHYYGKKPVKKDTSGKIKVEKYGEIDFEAKYLMGIAEMPSSWHPEALKAQAVAARTYAYRYFKDGSTICTTERCQVYLSSKADNPPDAWKQAVRDTKGQILEDVVTYYSSTAGGWAKTSGWDTTDGKGGSNFIDKSYEKIGGSPWLYKAWYTKDYSVNSDKCGRSNPWLSPEEMADIVNTAIALKTSGIDTSRITPVTTSCWGGDPYSMSELRNLVKDKGGIDKATSVSVSQGDGVTKEVTINGVTISASKFREAFNLRAPGYIKIPQSSSVYGAPFFNIEKK